MQNSNLTALAAELNKMKNPKLIGTSIGEVTKADPLTISIAEGLITLTEGEDLSVCEKLKKTEYEVKYTWESGDLPSSGKITIDPKVKKGDMVLVIPAADEQSWVAVDRIGE